MTTKIKRLKNGHVAAYSGKSNLGTALMRWYEEGADADKWPKFMEKDEWPQLIVATPSGCFFYCDNPEKVPVEGRYQAWGGGRDMAMGALEMGADAVRAVEVAIKLEIGCGMGIDAFFVEAAAVPSMTE